jgi:hypothetical protein
MKDKLLALNYTQFENLVFDLVQLLGLKNCVWMTPGRDGGRDIQGIFSSLDFSKSMRFEKWYIECKKYKSTVDWPTIWQKISIADVHKADLLLLVTTAEISPQAKNEIDQWNNTHRYPKVRFWDIHSLIRNLHYFPILSAKYNLLDNNQRNINVFNTSLLRILKKYIYIDAGYKEFQDGKENKHVSRVILELISLIENITAYLETKGVLYCTNYSQNDENFNRFKQIPFDKFIFNSIISIIEYNEAREVDIEYLEDSDKYMVKVNLSKLLNLQMYEEIKDIFLWDKSGWYLEPLLDKDFPNDYNLKFTKPKGDSL